VKSGYHGFASCLRLASLQDGGVFTLGYTLSYCCDGFQFHSRAGVSFGLTICVSVHVT
jgi:hypothetical protein